MLKSSLEQELKTMKKRMSAATAEKAGTEKTMADAQEELAATEKTLDSDTKSPRAVAQSVFGCSGCCLLLIFYFDTLIL